MSFQSSIKLKKQGSKIQNKNLFCDKNNKCKIGLPKPVKTGGTCYKDSDCVGDSSNKVSCMGDKGTRKKCTREGSRGHNSNCGSPWISDKKSWGDRFCKAGHKCFHWTKFDLLKLDKFNTKICRKNNFIKEGRECYGNEECQSGMRCINQKCTCDNDNHCKMYNSTGFVDNSYDKYCWKEKDIFGNYTKKTKCKNKTCEQWNGSCGSGKQKNKSKSCPKGKCSKSRCCIKKGKKKKKAFVF